MRCPMCKRNIKEFDRSRHGVYDYEELEMIGCLIDIVRHMEAIERRERNTYKSSQFGRYEEGFASGLSEALCMMNFNNIYTRIWKLLRKLMKRRGNDEMRKNITDCFEGWKIKSLLGQKGNR